MKTSCIDQLVDGLGEIIRERFSKYGTILGMQLLFNQNIVRLVGYYSFESNVNEFDGKSVNRVTKS